MENRSQDLITERDHIESDHVNECTGNGVDTGLETAIRKPMMQLVLVDGDGDGDDDDDDDDGGSSEVYPERPDETPCKHYLRTGVCGYGSRCRYNHPRDRAAVIRSITPGQGDYPEREGEPVCEYYMKTGMCKYFAFCKYHHPRKGDGSHVSLNHLGYPLRPGEKECGYYVRTGRCKFGAICKFHHPQPDGVQVPALAPASVSSVVPAPISYPFTVQSFPPSPSQPYGVVAGNWPVSMPPSLLPGYYNQGYGPMLPPHGMVPFPSWSPYPTLANQVATSGNQPPTLGPGAYYGMPQWPPSGLPPYTGAYTLVTQTAAGPSTNTSKELSYPQRPGQAECRQYMSSGECKYISSCIYHHPQLLTQHNTVRPVNLPLNPGSPTCSNYAQYGVCKFGAHCRYDHPIGKRLGYSASASSLTDIPVAPYPSSPSALAETQYGLTSSPQKPSSSPNLGNSVLPKDKSIPSTGHGSSRPKAL